MQGAAATREARWACRSVSRLACGFFCRCSAIRSSRDLLRAASADIGALSRVLKSKMVRRRCLGSRKAVARQQAQASPPNMRRIGICRAAQHVPIRSGFKLQSSRGVVCPSVHHGWAPGSDRQAPTECSRRRQRWALQPAAATNAGRAATGRETARCRRASGCPARQDSRAGPAAVPGRERELAPLLQLLRQAARSWSSELGGRIGFAAVKVLRRACTVHARSEC